MLLIRQIWLGTFEIISWVCGGVCERFYWVFWTGLSLSGVISHGIRGFYRRHRSKIAYRSLPTTSPSPWGRCHGNISSTCMDCRAYGEIGLSKPRLRNGPNSSQTSLGMGNRSLYPVRSGVASLRSESMKSSPGYLKSSLTGASLILCRY